MRGGHGGGGAKVHLHVRDYRLEKTLGIGSFGKVKRACAPAVAARRCAAGRVLLQRPRCLLRASMLR
jgi:hypothetical protein